MNPYEVLGISPDASPEAIETAYKIQRSRNHPDKGGDPARFRQVKAAYQQLTKGPCPDCGGKGHIIKRQGFFAHKVNCPRCWKI